MAFTKIVPGVRTTSFYPPNFPVPGSIDASSANVNDRQLRAVEAQGRVGEPGVLPSLWWLGILILLVALRLAYEFA